jgi:hypothetical protein
MRFLANIRIKACIFNGKKNRERISPSPVLRDMPIYCYFFAGIKLFIFATIFWIIVIVGTGVGTAVGTATVAFAFGAAAFFAGAAYMETSEIAKSMAMIVIMIFFICFSPPFSIIIIQSFYCRFA